MKVIGIDLSLRSTGLVCLDGNDVTNYTIINPDPKKYNDESLLIYNSYQICDFVKQLKPDVVALEGLSFGSLTGSKDILAGNFWNLRIGLKHLGYKTQIIPVLTWRSPLFTKEERKKHKEDTKLAKEWKAKVKGIKSTNARKEILAGTEQIFLDADIKNLTFRKLPATIQDMFMEFGLDKGAYDLTDAYFIAKHLQDDVKRFSP